MQVAGFLVLIFILLGCGQLHSRETEIASAPSNTQLNSKALHRQEASSLSFQWFCENKQGRKFRYTLDKITRESPYTFASFPDNTLSACSATLKKIVKISIEKSYLHGEKIGHVLLKHDGLPWNEDYVTISKWPKIGDRFLLSESDQNKPAEALIVFF